MRPPDKQRDRLQIPLMYAFRDAFDKRDANKHEDVRVDGERVVSDRGSLRRRGAEESLLKQDLAIDLAALLDTIDLGSAVDISDMPFVTKSVLNFGLADLTSISVGSASEATIGENLKTALLEHEPRLSRDSLTVERVRVEDEAQQRIRYKVSADLICKPLDIPIEFVAEVDGTSGKVALPRPPGPA